jgi:hypothetical protein
MLWTLRKIDSLVGTVIAAAAAVAAAQIEPFIAYYLQRLGGHLDEARLNSQSIAGSTAEGLEPATRDLLVAEAHARVLELEKGFVAIVDAGMFERPFVFARHAEPDIASAAFAAFEPALSLDTASLVYGAVGMLLAWGIWEIVKLPFAFAVRAATAG